MPAGCRPPVLTPDARPPAWLSSPPETAWWVAGVAAGCLIVGWWWPHPATIAHEMGHATAGWVLGRRVRGIRLHTDTSGVTTTSGADSGPRMLLVVLCGYPAPPVAAAGLAWAWAAGKAGWAMTSAAALLVVALLLARSWFGVVFTAACVAVVGGVAAAAVWPPGLPAAAGALATTTVAAAAVAVRRRSRRQTVRDPAGLAVLGAGMTAVMWLLRDRPAAAMSVLCAASAALMLAGGVRGLWTAWQVWGGAGQSGSDAEQAAYISGIPQAVWLVLFSVIGVAAAAAAGWAVASGG